MPPTHTPPHAHNCQVVVSREILRRINMAGEPRVMGQSHSQTMTPHTVDESWRERIYKEELKAHEFWTQDPDVAETLNMGHTLRKPKNLVPTHAMAPKSAAGDDATSIISFRTTTTNSVTTQVLAEKVERLERHLAKEQSRRRQVEDQMQDLLKKTTVRSKHI
ncbi:hypothetical protein CYMTET_15952 [Cymbomonas tetramitiformis]|uniref:Uncharacterized protein n=1 Tax=Cymbomonas tetramitiformis TaxID=36881 RepID=A0AAE0GD66_9CHLO|nr:hypothetical protein CYMTET_15952 [Cymbomonas tetramitiformis]